jgi:outer membrane biosynthesis protein TonB
VDGKGHHRMESDGPSHDDRESDGPTREFRIGEPERTPEPTPEQTPEPKPEPEPEQTPEPTLERTAPEPTPELTPTPELELTPKPTPEATRNLVPETERTPEPTPEPTKQQNKTDQSAVTLKPSIWPALHAKDGKTVAFEAAAGQNVIVLSCSAFQANVHLVDGKDGKLVSRAEYIFLPLPASTSHSA